MALHFYYEADTSADLYATIPSDGTLAEMCGLTTRGDQPATEWLYDASSAATDDGGISVIKPTLQTGNGRWLINTRAQLQSDWDATSGMTAILNKPNIVDQEQSNWTETDDTQADYIKNKPLARTTSIPSRSLNTVFQISTTQDALAMYTVQVAAGLGQSGTIQLESSPDDSSWTTETEFTFGNTLTIALGNETSAGQLSCYVPMGHYIRLISSGTATSSILAGQRETLL